MNPYQPPAGSSSPTALHGEGCPQCGSSDLHSPTFTWWGGAVGPKMFKHTVCRGCGYGFNRETRRSNRKPITIYVVISTVVAVALVATFEMVR